MSMDSLEPGAVRVWLGGYDGLLHDDGDVRFRTLVYGWDTRGRSAETRALVPTHGAVWGFVTLGIVQVSSSGNHPRTVREAEFFVTANGAEFMMPPGVQLFAVQQIGFRAIPMVGGPIEARGRLCYIDGCSDSLLVPPSVAGNPCLNHLHFPPDIDQRLHTHASTRAGVVARGGGRCVTTQGAVSLAPGSIFVVPSHGVHGFQSFAATMDVITYHPDSDHGPTHGAHPMINRTLVDGQKLNSADRHDVANVIEGYFLDLPP